MRLLTITCIVATTIGVRPAGAATGAPTRLLIVATPESSMAVELAPVLGANVADLAIEASLLHARLPEGDAAAEAAAAARLGAEAGMPLVLWVRVHASPPGRRITLLLADRLTDKTVIRSVTVPADLPPTDLLRLLALKTRGLIRASLLERERTGPASAPGSLPAPAATGGPSPRAAGPPVSRSRPIALEAGGRVASYPGAQRGEYGLGVAARVGRGSWRAVASVETLWQQADRDGVAASLVLVVPAAGLERVVRAGALEGWAGLRAGLLVGVVHASGPDVVVGTDTRVRAALGASIGGAINRGRIRVAAELGVQGIPGSHGYSVHGGEVVGIGSVRAWVALSAGCSL
ncbi:MAG: hypothetical protein HY906_12065 [Deltaproteobacteria bacterium]|nr:hypothetical protein [Deltaproteobacteria bacterium]